MFDHIVYDFVDNKLFLKIVYQMKLCNSFIDFYDKLLTNGKMTWRKIFNDNFLYNMMRKYDEVISITLLKRCQFLSKEMIYSISLSCLFSFINCQDFLQCI